MKPALTHLAAERHGMRPVVQAAPGSTVCLWQVQHQALSSTSLTQCRPDHTTAAKCGCVGRWPGRAQAPARQAGGVAAAPALAGWRGRSALPPPAPVPSAAVAAPILRSSRHAACKGTHRQGLLYPLLIQRMQAYERTGCEKSCFGHSAESSPGGRECAGRGPPASSGCTLNSGRRSSVGKVHGTDLLAILSLLRGAHCACPLPEPKMQAA
jgi:hypothetical protein